MRKLVVGNWKMHGLPARLAEVDGIAQAAVRAHGIDVLLCPPFTLLHAVAARQPGLMLGGQDVHPERDGPYTGSISADMLREAGCRYAIVGHSERRAGFGETDALVRAKACAAIAGGLVALVCIGESAAQRAAGDAGAVVARQIEGSVPADATGATLAVCYEPIWAIGTGRPVSCQEAERMCALIRAALIRMLGEGGRAVRLLYGGSVRGGNAAALLSVPDVDGVLAGGASLRAADFAPIIAAAASAAH